MVARLEGKKVLVWGGGSGIGLACAVAAAAEGAAVFISGRREKVLRDAAESFAPGAFRAGDATSIDDVRAVTAAAAERMGGLDTLIVSAGAGGRTSIFDTEPAEFQRIVDNNMGALFLTVQQAVPHLLAAGAGSVIAISSMYGLVGQYERVAYSGAKAGMNGMIRALALDFADKGVRANSICPGFIETDLAREVAAQEPDPEAAMQKRRGMHPIPRAGQPEEIAALAVYLASDAAAFTTGQSIAVDGGFTIR